MGKAARAKVLALQRASAELPQAVDHIRTRHYFADGMYCREVYRDKHVLIVGKVHKKDHFYIVADGTVAVTNGDGPATIYKAPAVIVSKPGTKRAVLALTNATCVTVHRTDKTDLDEIEDELVEPDETALFDARNNVKLLEG